MSAAVIGWGLGLPHPAAVQSAVRSDDQLGAVAFHVACDASVQPEFDRGVALLHHMTYPVAYSVFQAVTERDPTCAMAYWGMAMTLFQPLWPTRPSGEELARGWTLMGEAHRRGPRTDRERMFVEAGAAFFDPDGAPDYWTRLDRWASAMTRLFRAFPADREVQAFFALAELATESRSGTPADHHARAAAILRGILNEEPTHPGAVHYTIHANDFTGREHEDLDVVRSYGKIAPRNPHALHMPTHIFVRLGEWSEVIDWNLRAAEAALGQRVGPNGEWVWDEYPHAVEYLAYAYLQRGDDAAAARVVRELQATRDLQPSFKTAFHLASTSARYALERHDWRAAAVLSVRSPAWVDWNQFRWPEAITWFARGIGAARIGADSTVAESADHLETLAGLSREAGEMPFAAQIEILRLEVAAWHACRLDNTERALQLMQEAVQREDETPKHPVTPAPTIPARELLGDLLLEMGDPARALEAYRASDERTPHRFNTILGMARAQTGVGDLTGANASYSRLLDLAVTDSPRSSVSEAHRRVGGAGGEAR